MAGYLASSSGRVDPVLATSFMVPLAASNFATYNLKRTPPSPMVIRKPKASTARAQTQTGSYVHTDAKAIIRPQVSQNHCLDRHGKIAVRAIDDRGNDPMAVKEIKT